MKWTLFGLVAVIMAGCTAREFKENAVGVYNLGVRKTSQVQVDAWNTGARTLQIAGNVLPTILDEVTE